MRIRSTKPEFWRSKTIAALPWDVRLVLKGLESYVDDNGVGKDDIALIAADVFPRDLSASPRDTLASLSGALLQLAEANLVARYSLHGEDLLYIRRWRQLQRIDKPAAGRWPRPDGSIDYKDEVDESVSAGQRHNGRPQSAVHDSTSREDFGSPREDFGSPPEKVAPGTGEQGNRGTGEQGNSAAAAAGDAEAPRTLAIVDDASTAQTLVGEWIDHCADRPPGRVVGQVAKELKTLLDEGIEPDRIRRALAEWNRKGLHPSTLPSVVHEIANRAPGVRGQQATDEMFDRAMQRAIHREAAQ